MVFRYTCLICQNFEGFKRVTRDLVSRLHVIESNANDLELNDPKALVGLFRESLPDGARLNVFIDLAGSWGQANTELMTSAREILDWSAKPSEFDSLRIRFISAFEHFQEITDRLSSLVASQALENLSKTFRDQLPFQLFP